MAGAALEFDGIGKSFYGSSVLSGISFAIRGGSVLGLIGENGAGKSTLMNIMGGNLIPDQGEMRLDGRRFAPAGPSGASEAGIALVHQELNLFPNLTLAENLFLSDFPGRGPRRLGWIDRSRLKEGAEALLRRVGLTADPSTVVDELSPGQRQMLEIAVALKGRPSIVAFDEPTTSLTRPEAAQLFEIIGQLKREGVAIVYISHNLGEISALCDELVVLRDGRIQGAGRRTEFTVPRMIELMVGRELTTLFPERRSAPRTAPVLQVRNLTGRGVIEDVSFELREGEILGMAGLMGAGRTELARSIFGLDPRDSGRIWLRGREVSSKSPRESVGHGLAFLTEERGSDGLLPPAGVEENLSLVGLRQFARSPFGRLRKGELRRCVGELVVDLDIRARSLEGQPVRTLSGGNQQKVVLGKWLLAGSDVLLLDEPTRGVDVGARYEIYERIVNLADRGTSVLLISSEMEELMGLSDRILVMSQGRIKGSIDRSDFNQNDLLRSALGEERLG